MNNSRDVEYERVDYPKLHEFVISLDSENDSDFIENVLKYSQKIDGLYPEIYGCHFPVSGNLTFKLPEFLTNFTGIALFQSVVCGNLMRYVALTGSFT